MCIFNGRMEVIYIFEKKDDKRIKKNNNIFFGF